MHSSLSVLPAALVAIFAGLFIALLLMLGSLVRSDQRRELAERIEHYGPQRRRRPGNDDGSTRQVNKVAVDVTKRLMSPAAQGRLAERLDLAAVARTPAEWVLIASAAGAVVAATLSIVTGLVWVGALCGVLVGWLAGRVSLSYLIGRRRHAFSDQLPDLLQLMASALQSGFSLLQALDAVVRENVQPAAGEFARALAEAKLGGDLHDCLGMVATRMDSADLRWAVMAIRIQQGIGGNLAEVLTTIAGTIRERAALRRQVRALSAEGRLSAVILVALPILVGGWLFLTNRSYMRPLYTTHIGLLMLGTAVVLLIIGTIWMRKTIQLEV